ncbi:hypothetical protein NFI96_014523 [Prochilodus magdalenae]|nr:hypothetical protein NFI96_014523 [Prochilodus magdalenae]
MRHKGSRGLNRAAFLAALVSPRCGVTAGAQIRYTISRGVGSILRRAPSEKAELTVSGRIDREALCGQKCELAALDSDVDKNAMLTYSLVDSRTTTPPAVIYPSSGSWAPSPIRGCPAPLRQGTSLSKVTAVDADSGHNLLGLSYPASGGPRTRPLFSVNLQYRRRVRTKRSVSEQDELLSETALIEIKDNGEPVQTVHTHGHR